MFKPELKVKVLNYIDYIRPYCEKDDESFLFLQCNGKQITKLSNYIRYMSSQLKVKLPSATAVRKGGPLLLQLPAVKKMYVFLPDSWLMTLVFITSITRESGVIKMPRRPTKLCKLL